MAHFECAIFCVCEKLVNSTESINVPSMLLLNYLRAQEDHEKDVVNAALTLRNSRGLRIYKLERTKSRLNTHCCAC